MTTLRSALSFSSAARASGFSDTSSFCRSTCCTALMSLRGQSRITTAHARLRRLGERRDRDHNLRLLSLEVERRSTLSRLLLAAPLRLLPRRPFRIEPCLLRRALRPLALLPQSFLGLGTALLLLVRIVAHGFELVIETGDERELRIVFELSMPARSAGCLGEGLAMTLRLRGASS